jgi:hypothetical protein
VPIWSDILEKKELYINPYFNNKVNESWLNVGIEEKYMTIWSSLFLGDYTKIKVI